MSTIIPLLGTRPSISNITATMVLTTDATIAQGDTRYASSMEMPSFFSRDAGAIVFIYNGNYTFIDNVKLINNGTIWGRYTESGTLTYDAYLVRTNADITNNGKAVLEVDHGLAYGFLFGRHLTNNGEIRAYAYTGSAWGIRTEDAFNPNVTNSGLVTSYAGTGMAYGVDLGNGGTLSNLSSGKILAEGIDARGVFFGRGTFYPDDKGTPEIVNAGLIEAHSLDARHASFGIYVSHLEPELMRIVNSGTIRGDYAIYSNSYAFSPAQKSAETVTNEAGGRIEGDIFLDLGDDIIINHGTIIGDVVLSQGDDQFDTRSGIWSGFASLGFGNDVFLGGAGDDVVLGEEGDDRLEGNAGRDLLIAARGNDTLIGGAGKDGLYGEFGNDVIVTEGGDYVLAGNGDDRVELGDYTFDYVDGGSGTDTLVLPNSIKILDLSAALTSGSIAHFERIVLPGAQQLVIRDSDLQRLPDDRMKLTISAGASGTISLVGTWTETDAQSIDGILYRAFHLNGGTVLAQSGATVSVLDAAPASASGLEPIQAGLAAPLPGSVPGTGLLSGDTLANGYLYIEPLVIEQDENWTSTNGTYLLGTWSTDLPTLTNNGNLVSVTESVPFSYLYGIRNLQKILRAFGLSDSATTGQGAEVIETYYSGRITNNGLISATSIKDGYALAIFVGEGPIHNQGRIEAKAESVAVGIMTYESVATFTQDGPFTNMGQLHVESSAALAIGVVLGNRGTVVNKGVMEILGGQGAIAITGGGSFNVINSGSIAAITTKAGGSHSVAFSVYANDVAQIDNTGSVKADIVLSCFGTDVEDSGTIIVNNSGILTGEMRLVRGWDQITNSGTIVGDVFLGGGTDVFNGADGTQIGTIYGEDGDDKLSGGIGDDRFDGGEGADTIAGGAGSDTAMYKGVRNMFSISKTSNGFVVTDNTAVEGTDTLTEIEQLIFADMTINLTIGNNDDEGGDDKLSGGIGDDRFDGGEGADTIAGGAGFDTAVYKGDRNMFSISKTSNGFVVTDITAVEGTDTLTEIEQLIFADMTINLTIGDNAKSISSAALQTLEELYVAFFNRVPDADGLNYWITQFKNGQSISNIADSFYSAAIQSNALTDYSSTMTDAEFVQIIYKNVLGRSGLTAPPDEDVAYWVGELANGHRTKGTLVSTILDSAHTFKGDKTWGGVADLLDNKAAVANWMAVQQGITYRSPADSITEGMAIAAAVTPTDTQAAIFLVGVVDLGFSLFA